MQGKKIYSEIQEVGDLMADSKGKDDYRYQSVRGAGKGFIRVEHHRKPLFGTRSDRIRLSIQPDRKKEKPIDFSMRADEAVLIINLLSWAVMRDTYKLDFTPLKCKGGRREGV